jgi:hypothetical protein
MERVHHGLYAGHVGSGGGCERENAKVGMMSSDVGEDGGVCVGSRGLVRFVCGGSAKRMIPNEA